MKADGEEALLLRHHSTLTAAALEVMCGVFWMSYMILRNEKVP
jgi:hypothetical protein